MTLINKWYYKLHRLIYNYPCKAEVFDMMFNVNNNYLTTGDRWYLNKYIRTGSNKDFIKLFTEMYDYGFFVIDNDIKR